MSKKSWSRVEKLPISASLEVYVAFLLRGFLVSKPHLDGATFVLCTVNTNVVTIERI